MQKNYCVFLPSLFLIPLDTHGPKARLTTGSSSRPDASETRFGAVRSDGEGGSLVVQTCTVPIRSSAFHRDLVPGDGRRTGHRGRKTT